MSIEIVDTRIDWDTTVVHMKLRISGGTLALMCIEAEDAITAAVVEAIAALFEGILSACSSAQAPASTGPGST
jgi:hypothetical protein